MIRFMENIEWSSLPIFWYAVYEISKLATGMKVFYELLNVLELEIERNCNNKMWIGFLRPVETLSKF